MAEWGRVWQSMAEYGSTMAENGSTMAENGSTMTENVWYGRAHVIGQSSS